MYKLTVFYFHYRKSVKILGQTYQANKNVLKIQVGILRQKIMLRFLSMGISTNPAT